MTCDGQEMGQTVMSRRFSSLQNSGDWYCFGQYAPSQWYHVNHFDYDFETFTCAQCADCSNMLQVLWVNVTRIGCASHVCYGEYGYNGEILLDRQISTVCNYDLAYDGSQPFPRDY